MALKKCELGPEVTAHEQWIFMCALIPCEKFLIVNQFDNGQNSNPKYHYKFTLTNNTPITTKPLHLKPQEDVWLDVHFGDLITKGLIGPILPHEQPKCNTPLLIVLRV